MIQTLRPYQTEAVEITNSTEGPVLIVLPTGSGKTHVIAAIAASNLSSNILILSHTKEILLQNADKLKKYVKPSDVGYYSAGLGKRQLKKYCMASIQTVYKLQEQFTKYDIIIIDEVHTVPPKGTGRYRTFLAGFPSNTKIVGLTATPFRLDHGLITEDHIFNEVNYEVRIEDLIKQGYLCPVVTKETNYKYNLDGIKIIAGDYSKKDLVDNLDKKALTDKICADLASNCKHRKKWLVFAIDIDHAEHIATSLQKHGISAAAIHSKLDIDRDDITSLHREGHIQAIVNVEMLTTGYDDPEIDLIAVLRPTMSHALHVQMVGRGTRPAPGKKDCLVKDYAGNIERLGPINDITIETVKASNKSKKNEEPLTKTCPDCLEVVPLRVMTCPDCGYVFKPAPTKLVELATEKDVIVDKPVKQVPTKLLGGKILKFIVNKVSYKLGEGRRGEPDYLIVKYHCGIRVFSQNIYIRREGYTRVVAKNWWAYRSSAHFPTTAYEALAAAARGELKEPKSIKVSVTKNKDEVIGFEF
jgi:DNA repair protein RadD